MLTISDTELRNAFPREYPKDLARTTEGQSPSQYDFDQIEAERLAGKSWEDVGPDLLREFFDIASWLNTQAFHYFFPAFIKQSQVDVEKTSLVVNSLISMLADEQVHWHQPLKDSEVELLKKYPESAEAFWSIDGEKISAWRHERWKLFTKQQWALIIKWLNWIDRDEKWEVDQGVLRQAITNAEKWQAQQSSVSQ